VCSITGVSLCSNPGHPTGSSTDANWVDKIFLECRVTTDVRPASEWWTGSLACGSENWGRWSRMVTCQQALELFGDLVDDGLGRGDRYRVRLHLLICRHCRRYLSSYRATIRAEKLVFRAAEMAAVEEEIPESQVASILNAAYSD